MGIFDKVKQGYAEISSKLKGYATQGVEKIKEARAPDTPLEQMVNDWKSIYQKVDTAANSTEWLSRMEYLKNARDTLVEMVQKYPSPALFETTDETAKTSYQNLWNYREDVLSQLQKMLSTNNMKPLPELAQNMKNELITPYEQAEKSETNKMSVKDAKEHLEKNGKKYGKGVAAGAALYTLWRIIKR